MVWIRIIVAFVYLTSQRYKSNGHVLIAVFENGLKTLIVLSAIAKNSLRPTSPGPPGMLLRFSVSPCF